MDANSKHLHKLLDKMKNNEYVDDLELKEVSTEDTRRIFLTFARTEKIGLIVLSTMIFLFIIGVTAFNKKWNLYICLFTLGFVGLLSRDMIKSYINSRDKIKKATEELNKIRTMREERRVANKDW